MKKIKLKNNRNLRFPNSKTLKLKNNKKIIFKTGDLVYIDNIIGECYKKI